MFWIIFKICSQIKEKYVLMNKNLILEYVEENKFCHLLVTNPHVGEISSNRKFTFVSYSVTQ